MTERHGQDVMMRGTNPIKQARRGRNDPAQSAPASTRAPRPSQDRELLEGIFAVGSERTYRHPENGT